MSKNIRIRTTPNGGDNHVKIQLNQDFDFLEILSLKISQEDVYRSFYSNYGVVVGRVIMNSGVGVPNARISVFIPLTDDDSQDSEISEIYPYRDLQDVNSDGVRYNTLPKDSQGDCHVPIGTFPTKRELVDNEILFEIHQKYYKYTTTTNGAGDFMLFGVPVGNHVINVDVDLSDIGIFSQRPYDFIEQGNSKKLFESPTKFKGNTNLNNLTQVKNRQVGVNVIPFWGEKESNEVGISRIDVDLNYNIAPKAIFVGSIFGDNEKNSVNKNCRPRRNLGKVCEMGEGEGTVQMLRKTIFGDNERFDVDGGRVITDKGTWAYQIPMNLDYMITDEFGNLTRTEDTTKGIPTRARVRFKINLDQTGGESRLRTRAKYLVPHNPDNLNEVDYTFDESTPNNHFRDLYWNKIYTVKNHIARFQKNSNIENRNFVGYKDVDDCVGVKSPPPFNKLDTDFNPLYVVLCLVISIILTIINVINSILKVNFGIGRLCKRLIPCLQITCPINNTDYTPGCTSSKCKNKHEASYGKALDCFQISLAVALNIFKFDFYNDWMNGSLYAFLFKYKKPRNSTAKYCGDGNGDGNNNIVNTAPEGQDIKFGENWEIDEGLVVSGGTDELFYKPLTKKGHKFYSTDIFNLGAVFPCDWQQIPKIQPDLIATTYNIPPLTEDTDDIDSNNVTAIEPLLFKLTCTKVDANQQQATSIRRICEIGVGLDEYQVVNNVDSSSNMETDDIKPNKKIDNPDIINVFLRDNLIKLNDASYFNASVDDINSNFGAPAYESYRGKFVQAGITQYFGNSFYFYFGTSPNNSAIDLMNSKYFTECERRNRNKMVVVGNVSNVTTVGGMDGSITTTILGGAPDYIYQWFNVAGPFNGFGQLISIGSESNISGLNIGTYYVLVTDNNGEGITVKKTFIVGGLKPLTVDLEPRNAKTFGDPSGRIIFNSISGGIGPYDITITGPIAEPLFFDDIPYALTVEGLVSGTYSITITDSNTPTTVLTTGTTISTPDVLQIVNESYSGPTCVDFQDGFIEFNIQGGTPDFELYLQDSNNVSYGYNISTGGTYSFTELPSGDFTLKIIDNFEVGITRTYSFIEPLELVFSYSYKLGISTYRVENTISGVNYAIISSSGEEIAPFVGNGGLIISILLGDLSDSRVVSESGCESNSV